MNPKQLKISDFTYDLPAEKIAIQPLQERDSSKLLIYKSGSLSEDTYNNIDQHIPENSLLVFNNSKVINARVHFRKTSGSVIEIFCLEPADMQDDYADIMAKTQKVRWKCFVGGAAKWKGELLLKHLINDIVLEADLIEKLHDSFVIEFRWRPADVKFSEILLLAGDIPLPPYIKRSASLQDLERYQTIYADQQGSVAAPTAGLHFTETIFSKLKEKNIQHDYITLHVGAGTFKPVKSTVLEGHEMHAEWIDVDIEFIKKISKNKATVVAVGTTSVRTLETLYWLGVKSLFSTQTELILGQWEIYEESNNELQISSETALNGLVAWMEKTNRKRLFTQTRLLITPGYQFRLVNALITNFHQPQSTLLLLVAAATGKDWKRIYEFALENDYRFLSYGDGNLIFI